MPQTLSRRQALNLAASTAALLALPVRAAPAAAPMKIEYGYSAVTDFATVFLAIEQGFFARRGLEVEPKFLPINPTIIPALQSGSLQMGGPTPTGYLQAVEGGLDHVVIGGGGVLSKHFTEIGLVARPGVGIRSAADCVGKKIGVPGIGALLHVTFKQWLKLNKVDPRDVQFIEAAFPQQADLIRGGSLDAVVTGGPFMTRMLDSGAGRVVAYFMTFLDEGYPTILHTARRDWAEQNPRAVAAFRGGIQEAAAFMAVPSNDARVREVCGKYLKLPQAVSAKMQISPAGPVVTARHLQWWADLMVSQGQLKAVPNVANLLAKA